MVYSTLLLAVVLFIHYKINSSMIDECERGYAFGSGFSLAVLFLVCCFDSVSDILSSLQGYGL